MCPAPPAPRTPTPELHPAAPACDAMAATCAPQAAPTRYRCRSQSSPQNVPVSDIPVHVPSPPTPSALPLPPTHPQGSLAKVVATAYEKSTQFASSSVATIADGTHVLDSTSVLALPLTEALPVVLLPCLLFAAVFYWQWRRRKEPITRSWLLAFDYFAFQNPVGSRRGGRESGGGGRTREGWA